MYFLNLKTLLQESSIYQCQVAIKRVSGFIIVNIHESYLNSVNNKMRLPVLQFTIFICLQHTTELCHWSLKGHTNHWQPENDL